MTITTMPAENPAEGSPDEVTVEDETITIRLTSYNPAVRDALDGHDPVARMHQLLDVGARALHQAGASAQSQAMAAQVEQLKNELHQAVTDTHEQLTAHTESLFGEEEDGSVTNRLTATVQEVERLLGETFNADSKSSAIGKIEQTLKAAIEDDQAARRRQLQAAFDPDGDGQWAKSLNGLLERLDKLERSVGQVGEKVAASQAAAAAHDRSAVKGFDYEGIVDDVAGRIAAAQGDVLEHVATTKGVLGQLAGDFVVTVNLDGHPVEPARYVVEAQDQKLSLAKAQKKADAARRNRDADTAVMVFSSEEHAPTSAPFVPLGPLGETAIVVLDKHQPDPLALQVAMGWARAATRLHESGDETDLDRKRIHQLLDGLRRSLDAVSTIKRSLTMASNAISDGHGQIETLATEIKDALDELDALVQGTEE